MMDFEKLFRLMSLREDFKWYESWDDHWDWLYSNDFIAMNGSEIPSLTKAGEKVINYAVKKAADVI